MEGWVVCDLGLVSASEMIIPGGKHECKLWCIMGTPSLGILAAADGAGLVAFCTSLGALPAGVAMLVALEASRDCEDRG
jgi:hypothetical protein